MNREAGERENKIKNDALFKVSVTYGAVEIRKKLRHFMKEVGKGGVKKSFLKDFWRPT